MATGELRWLQEANRLARLAVELFADDERGGFFLSPADGEELVARKKDLEDHPTPSGNSMLASVLLRLARIYGDDELERRAVGVFRLVHGAVTRAPSAFGHALSALDLHFSPPREIAIVGPVDSPVARAALEPFQPNTVVAVGPSEEVPLLAGKTLVDGKPAVYVCERFACQASRSRRRTKRSQPLYKALTPRGRLPAMAASTRWIVLAALAAGLTAVAALSGSARPASRSPPRPSARTSSSSMTDDQTVESMRVMPNVKTLIADQGVTFDNSFVSYSLCCPSRSTFLTGQYAHNHGVWGNAAPNGGYYKLDSTNTLPVWLQRAGYQTIHLGKYLNQYGTRNPREIPPGWGQWYGTPDPSTYRYLNYQINENGNLVQFGNAAADYKTDVESRLARRPHLAPGRRSAPVLHVGRVPRAALGRPARRRTIRAGSRRRRPRRATRTASRTSRSRCRRRSTRPTSPTSRRRSGTGRADRSGEDQRDPRELPAAARVAARGRRRGRARS